MDYTELSDIIYRSMIDGFYNAGKELKNLFATILSIPEIQSIFIGVLVSATVVWALTKVGIPRKFLDFVFNIADLFSLLGKRK